MTEPDRMIEELRSWIRDQLRSGRSLRQIAREAGLSEATLLQFESEKWNPTLKTIRQLSFRRVGDCREVSDLHRHPSSDAPHTGAAAP